MPFDSRLPSVMQHSFSRVPAPQLPRASFDRRRGRKLTFDTGWLVPGFVDEVLPGDTVSMKATFFARIATLLYPLMDNLFFDTFWFYVPNRILWDNWERFQGARIPNTNSSIDYETPVVDGSESGSFLPTAFSLWDYFGMPIPNVAYGSHNLPVAFFSRAYNMIWNEWFRDQDLQNQAPFDTDDGPDLQSDYVLRRRGKRHDYFTACRPWPQKGDAVSIPLGTSAPVIGDGGSMGFRAGSTTSYYLNYNNNTGFNGILGVTDADGAPGAAPTGSFPTGDFRLGLSPDDSESGVIADLSSATSATINQLREAFATQQLLEIDARSGTRYTEILHGHFGVTVPDFRLQRPEYLGGSSQRIDVRAVAQTSETGSETRLGDLGAYGAVGDTSGFVKTFDEHGILMCLVNVRADVTYQQGLHRMFSRRTRYDFYMPSFAHIGEQPVLNKEIFLQGGLYPSTDNAVFGYQERWAEYRYGVSDVAGAFRSSYAQSLDAWHLALEFTALPALADGTFIQDAPPMARVVALAEGESGLPTGTQVILDAYYDTRWARVIPVYSVPGLERL